MSVSDSSASYYLQLLICLHSGKSTFAMRNILYDFANLAALHKPHYVHPVYRQFYSLIGMSLKSVDSKRNIAWCVVPEEIQPQDTHMVVVCVDMFDDATVCARVDTDSVDAYAVAHGFDTHEFSMPPDWKRPLCAYWVVVFTPSFEVEDICRLQ